MSKVAIVGDPSGTGTFTISAPNGNTDRTLVLPDEAGTVLTSASGLTAGNLTGSVPASAMPAGSVIQVVTGSNSGATITTTSGGLVSSGVSFTFTPKLANSKILVAFYFTGTSTNGSAQGGTKYTIYRDSTNLYGGFANLGHIIYSTLATDYIHAPLYVTAADTLATTATVNYTLYFSLVGSGTASIQRDWAGVHYFAQEIAA